MEAVIVRALGILAAALLAGAAWAQDASYVGTWSAEPDKCSLPQDSAVADFTHLEQAFGRMHMTVRVIAGEDREQHVGETPVSRPHQLAGEPAAALVVVFRGQPVDEDRPQLCSVACGGKSFGSVDRVPELIRFQSLAKDIEAATPDDGIEGDRRLLRGGVGGRPPSASCEVRYRMLPAVPARQRSRGRTWLMSATVSNGSPQVPTIGRGPSSQPSAAMSRSSHSCTAWVSVTATAVPGFALADPRHPGQCQGVFGAGIPVARAVGPLLLTVVVVDWAGPGWLVLAGVLLAAAVAVPPVAAWAGSRRPRTVSG